VGELDAIVAKARGEGSADAEAVLYPHWRVEPWPVPVDGTALLKDLTDCMNATSSCPTTRRPRPRFGLS
jgi:hypothetical protein